MCTIQPNCWISESRSKHPKWQKRENNLHLLLILPAAHWEQSVDPQQPAQTSEPGATASWWRATESELTQRGVRAVPRDQTSWLGFA